MSTSRCFNINDEILIAAIGIFIYIEEIVKQDSIIEGIAIATMGYFISQILNQ